MDSFYDLQLTDNRTGKNYRLDEYLNDIRQMINNGFKGDARNYLLELFDLAYKEENWELLDEVQVLLRRCSSRFSLKPYADTEGASAQNMPPKNTLPQIFSAGIDGEKIGADIKNINDHGVRGRAFAFVFWKVFRENDMLADETPKHFMQWIKNFVRIAGSEDEPWRGIKKEFKDNQTSEWWEGIVPGKKLGLGYRLLADDVREKYTEEKKDGSRGVKGIYT